MKKILLLAIAMMAFLATGCDEEFGFEYSAKINGDANGIVELTFPDGRLDLVGDAALAFNYGNVDTITVASNENLVSAKKLSEIALAAEADFAEQFNVAALTGTYDVVIDAYCREKGTGVVIKINKRFTNKAN